MKIAIVVPYYYPMVGGLESYVRHVTKYLVQDKKLDVFIITTNHLGNTDTQEIVEGIKVYRLHIWFKLSNTPINFSWIFKINRIFSQEVPDLIFAHTPVPFIADISAYIASLQKIPFILMYHAGNLKKNQFIADFVVSIYTNSFERLLFHFTQQIVVLNEFVKKNTLKNFEKKVQLVLPGIPINSHKNFIGKKKIKKQILFVAKLDRSHNWKGLKYLLLAMPSVLKKIPKATLTVVGDGDNLKFYKQFCKDSMIEKSVIFAGRKSSSEVANYYAQSDILVLPSTSSAESLGFVLLEAMKFGLPLIGSNVGGIPYVLHHNRNGIITEPRNSQAISKAITQLLLDSHFYSFISRNNLNDRELYSWEKHSEQLISLFNEAVSKKRSL